MASVLQEIRKWSSSLPYWEQAALDKIIGGVEITDEVIEELYQYQLEDTGLDGLPSSDRPTLCNLQPDAEEIILSSERPLLRRIYNLKNINALVPNQELTFGPQLTVIFGANGSGKSGYARVIGCAAFSRGDKEILPDVTKTQAVQDPLCADIDLLYGEKPATIHYVVGETCPQLRSFYVFDSTSVKNHLTKENPMSFSPGGLEVLTLLSAVTDRVRKRLQAECDKKQSLNIYEHLFIGESEVEVHIHSLGAATDSETLKGLAKLTPQEKNKIDKLELDIAELRNQKIAERIQELDQKINDLQLLREMLGRITHEVSDEAISTVNNSLKSFNQAKTLLQAISLESFRSGAFTQTGSEVWDKFIRAAYALGKAESKAYPANGDRCLLCLQPLTADARNLIERVWEYMQNDAQEKLNQTQAALQRHTSSLNDLNFRFLDDQSVSYRHLSTTRPGLLAQIQAFLRICEERRNGIVQAIASRQDYQDNGLPHNDLDIIRDLLEELESEKRRLESINVEDAIEKLEKEKRELEHRRLLSDLLEKILKFVTDAKWIQQANAPKVRRSTKHITKKYNELFEQLVSQEYIRLFEETLAKLKCPLGVMIETHGSKGETWKQIALKREDEQVISGTSPDLVLSEGEQRAVALADFLTEVALDENSAGILLDDPVSSLDFDWKGIIAQQVVDEAKRQQVIVFTHDLHFLSLLIEVTGEDVNISTHQIKKINNIPGWVFPDSGPIMEKEFRKPTKAKLYLDKARKARTANVEEEQMYLGIGYGQLRTTYEVFIQHELFQDVVLRFQERVSGDRLKKVYVDEGVRDEVSEAIGRLSRYVDAHSHSDLYVAQKPTVEMLEEEIIRFEELAQHHKQIRKDRKLDS